MSGRVFSIAKNQSAWIESELNFIIDYFTKSGQPLKINLKDPVYTSAGVNVANPKDWWMTHINPKSYTVKGISNNT